MKRTAAAVVFVGFALLIAGGVWFLVGKPTDGEVRSAEVTAHVSCTMTNQTLGTRRDCDDVADAARPEGPVVGPVVLASLGGLTVIVGAILYAGRDREPQVVYVDGPAPPADGPPPPERRSMVERMNEWNQRGDDA